MTRENVRQNHSNLHLFPYSRPAPFSRTRHFLAFASSPLSESLEQAKELKVCS